MNRRELHFITRRKEQELINKLLTIVDTRKFDPQDTALIMVSPDYSATVAMHLAHAWSKDGDMLSVIPVDVTYPDEQKDQYVEKFRHDMAWHKEKFKHVVLVEAGIIRGGNWEWLIEEFKALGYTREEMTLIALCENVGSRVKSDYVGEYYNDETHELMFYYERYNKHWPIR